MVEELPSSEGALLSDSCDDTRVLMARREQSGLKELTQLLFIWFDHIHRCQSQLQSLYSINKMWPLCLGLFELEVAELKQLELCELPCVIFTWTLDKRVMCPHVP